MQSLMQRRIRVWIIDGVGMSVILVLAWVMIAFWINPNRTQASRLRVAQHQARVAESAIEEQTARQQRLKGQLAVRIDALEGRYQSLPLMQDVSARIASIGATAGSVALTLEEMIPGPVDVVGPYATSTVRLKAGGSFAAFLAWLEMAHRTMPALDLSDLSLRRVEGSEAGNVQIEWNVALLLRTRTDGPRESLLKGRAAGGPS